MGLLSCRRCAGVCCADDLVECFDGCLDVFPFENKRWKKTKNRLTGPVDDDVTLHELGNNPFGQIRRVEFETQHQSDPSNIDDTIVTRCKFCKFCVEEFANIANMVQQVIPLDGVDDRDGNRTCQWAAAKRGAVHAGGYGECGV